MNLLLVDEKVCTCILCPSRCLIQCSEHFMRYNDFDVVIYFRWRGTRYILQWEKLWLSRSVLRCKRDPATRFKMCWSVSTRDLSNWRPTTLRNTPNIPLNSFDFVSFASILESSEEDKTIGNIKIVFFLWFLCLLLHMLFVCLCIDVIDHVVERDAVRETEKNGRRSKVEDLTLEDLE